MLTNRLLEFSIAYRVIQAPFAQRKLAPVLSDPQVLQAHRVLDVGCGPGTNAAYFRHTRYLGVDVNPGYVRSARRRHPRSFFVADVTRPFVRNCQFDCILSNSLFHHLDDPGTLGTLANLSDVLSADGHIHILDLVLPDAPSTARLLAHLDRGDYPRSVPHWRQLFTESFVEVALTQYQLGVPGLPLWHMVYFKGRSKSS